MLLWRINGGSFFGARQKVSGRSSRVTPYLSSAQRFKRSASRVMQLRRITNCRQDISGSVNLWLISLGRLSNSQPFRTTPIDLLNERSIDL